MTEESAVTADASQNSVQQLCNDPTVQKLKEVELADTTETKKNPEIKAEKVEEEEEEEGEDSGEEDENEDDEGDEDENEYYVEEEFRNPMELLMFGPSRELRCRKRRQRRSPPPQENTTEKESTVPKQCSGEKNTQEPEAEAANGNQDDDDDDSSVEYNEEDQGILWIGHTYGVNNTYVPPLCKTYGMEKPVDEDAYDTDTFRRWFFKVVGFVSYWSGLGLREKKPTNKSEPTADESNPPPEPPSITDTDALPRPTE